MRAEFAAVRAALDAALTWTVYDTTVPTAPTFPYVLLWGSGGMASTETLAGAADLSDRLGVTMAAGTADGVRQVIAATRAVLDGLTLTVEGRHVELHLWDSRAIQVDLGVTIPGTSTHPAFAVDIYTLTSVPL